MLAKNNRSPGVELGGGHVVAALLEPLPLSGGAHALPVQAGVLPEVGGWRQAARSPNGGVSTQASSTYRGPGWAPCTSQASPTSSPARRAAGVRQGRGRSARTRLAQGLARMGQGRRGWASAPGAAPRPPRSRGLLTRRPGSRPMLTGLAGGPFWSDAGCPLSPKHLWLPDQIVKHPYVQRLHPCSRLLGSRSSSRRSRWSISNRWCGGPNSTL